MKNPISNLFRRNSEELFAEKKLIRQHINELKDNMPEARRQSEADHVFSKIESLPEFKRATTILLYWSTGDELPTQTFIKKWCSTKIIVLPSVISDTKMELKRYFAIGKMKKGAFGIEEPDSIETYKGKVELVIVPGIAFDRKKNRLGRGKGYYDRFLDKNKVYKIGVGFDYQLLDKVPVSSEDIKMNKIVTASETI